VEFDDFLEQYQALLRAGRYEEAAALTETALPDLVASDRLVEAIGILRQTIEHSQNSVTLCQAWNNVGRIFYSKNLFDRARSAWLVAIGYCASDDAVEMARLRFSIANTFKMEGEEERALVGYKESFSISESCGFAAGMAENATQLADLLKIAGRIDEARDYAYRAISASKEANRLPIQERAVAAACNVASWLKELDRTNEARLLLENVRAFFPAGVSSEIDFLMDAAERKLKSE